MHTISQLGELAVEDAPSFARYFRMDKEKFNDLVGRISIHIQRQDTSMRAAISPGERLAVTLRYLTTGETFSSLESQFRISRTAISKIAYRCHQDVLLVQMCRLERLHGQQSPSFCLLT